MAAKAKGSQAMKAQKIKSAMKATELKKPQKATNSRRCETKGKNTLKGHQATTKRSKSRASRSIYKTLTYVTIIGTDESGHEFFKNAHAPCNYVEYCKEGWFLHCASPSS